MRPARSRETAARPTTARVRSQLQAHVEWLRGVPLGLAAGGIEWLVLATEREGERTIVVDRARLHATSRCIRELRREQPEALLRVVGDLDRWHERVSRVLDALKPSVHEGAPIDQAIEPLATALPTALGKHARRLLGVASLRRVVVALLFAHTLEPAGLTRALAQVDAHSALLGALLGRNDRHALSRALALVELVEEDQARTAGLLSLLEEARVYDPATCEKEPFRALFPLDPRPSFGMVPVRAPDPPKKRVFDAIAKVLPWLARRDQRSRRAVLALLDASAPQGLLRDWAKVHEELTALDAEARTRPEWSPRSRICLSLQALTARVPADFDVDAFADALHALAGAPEIARSLVGVVAALPAGPARVRWVRCWADAVRYLDPATRKKVPAYLEQLRGYLLDPGTVEEGHGLAAWEHLLSGNGAPGWWRAPDDDLLTTLPARSFAACFSALRAVTAPRTATLVRTLARLLATTHDAERAAARAVALTADEERPRPTDSALRIAHELEPSDAIEFARLVSALSGPGLADLASTLAAPGRLSKLTAPTRARLRRAFVESPALVPRIANAVSIATLAGSVPEMPEIAAGEPPTWAARYPRALSAALARLAATSPDAERIAARILARDFPPDEVFEGQIAALEARADPALAGRIEKLRARRAAPPVVGDGRLSNLADKLDRAAEKWVFDAWTGRLEEACRRGIARLLGLAECPPWALEDQNLRIVASALALESPHRELALRLLALRAGPPPWDLRDAPENVKAARALARKGLDLRPWIEGVGAVEIEGPEGRPMWLSLEDDPLEIFLMGERFHTCLSLGACNYFSVFANAADVDKRVVYARDGQGVAHARCLLVLDDEGRLLTFHAYAHHDAAVFAERFAAFANDLAARVGTVCAPRGTVRPRVAKAWYDDGPRQIGGSFPCLEPASAFRKALATIAPAALLAHVATWFAPRPLDALTLPLVLELSEVEERPELARPLVGALQALGEPLPDATVLTMTRLLARMGDLDGARALGRDVLVAELEAQLRRAHPEHFHGALLALLLELDPAAVLGVARRMGRKRGDFSREATRLYLLACGYEQLGRLRRAIDAWVAIGAHGGRSVREVERAIANLRARLAQARRTGSQS
ncbi:MAG: hypothetical protein JNL79_07810 [Myxococcales bacterium]|nr:hypothetical protein [Myxococcales bacterium]